MDCGNKGEPWNCKGDAFSFMEYNESTPAKSCGDLTYHVAAPDSGDMDDDLEYRRESSQVKRRRMLQFENEVFDGSLCNEMPLNFLKSKERNEFLTDDFFEMTQWDSEFADDIPSCDSLDPSSERWVADCLNEPDIHCSSEDMILSDLCHPSLENEAAFTQRKHIQIPKNIIIKGRMSSYIRTPPKSTSSVAYPFAFVKPCGVHGDVTLKDINQRIRIPPPPEKRKQGTDNSSSAYPTSAFSGKPVVGKTKIRTEGGKGSITITRTKG
ncbi:protein XRI1-like isoform X2 [Impatiens glandulifera]|uniref:protein XRI1-like isoform X2 n=1 Tax=Impatiens glandulifera TaxID=253017 RepID=UPI001FB15E91|nr:protein XRI1-like isoform X2 [Impatiens glandulifera]